MNKCDWKRPFFPLIILLLITACRTAPTLQPLLPTAVSPTTAPLIETNGGAAAPPPASTLMPTMTAVSSTTGTAPQPTAIIPPHPSSTETLTYRVTFVTADDVLNVRSGPGADNDIVGSLAPTANNVQITGPGEMTAGSTWMPIVAGDVNGWVNGRFLTTDLNADAFCQDVNGQMLLQGLRTAVATQDSAALAQLIHPERGLRVRRHWWNPELFFAGSDIPTLFSSATGYEWGVADGSGNPIVGSFSETILPLLQTHFVAAEASACHEILQGGTAGLVQLPDGYQQQFFYSFYFPGTDEFAGMDWGTWVIGVEQWQGAYYVTYLVHFEWEI